MRITTRRLAEELGIKPESIRTYVYRHGAYYGLRPIKAPNGRLLWPHDAVERLLGKKGQVA